MVACGEGPLLASREGVEGAEVAVVGARRNGAVGQDDRARCDGAAAAVDPLLPAGEVEGEEVAGEAGEVVVADEVAAGGAVVGDGRPDLVGEGCPPALGACDAVDGVDEEVVVAREQGAVGSERYVALEPVDDGVARSGCVGGEAPALCAGGCIEGVEVAVTRGEVEAAGVVEECGGVDDLACLEAPALGAIRGDGVERAAGGADEGGAVGGDDGRAEDALAGLKDPGVAAVVGGGEGGSAGLLAVGAEAGPGCVGRERCGCEGGALRGAFSGGVERGVCGAIGGGV